MFLLVSVDHFFTSLSLPSSSTEQLPNNKIVNFPLQLGDNYEASFEAKYQYFFHGFSLPHCRKNSPFLTLSVTSVFGLTCHFFWQYIFFSSIPLIISYYPHFFFPSQFSCQTGLFETISFSTAFYFQVLTTALSCVPTLRFSVFFWDILLVHFANPQIPHGRMLTPRFHMWCLLELGQNIHPVIPHLFRSLLFTFTFCLYAYSALLYPFTFLSYMLPSSPQFSG